MTDRAKSFLTFNLGHLLTLLGLAGGLIGLYTQRERDLAALHFTQQAHAATLVENTRRLAEIDRLGSTANRVKLEAQHALILAITARIEAQASTVGKVDVMANDIAWIKAELQRRPLNGRNE